MILETERLKIRPWSLSESDIDSLYQYAKSPNVGPHAGWSPHKDKAESRRILEGLFLPNRTWAICLAGTDKPVGSISLDKDVKRSDIASRELGYSLGEEYWYKGYMTEAAFEVIKYGFEVLCLDVISVCAAEENARSQRVIEKCGFVYEGTTRNGRPGLDGKPVGILNFSMLKEEWMGMKTRRSGR